MKLKSKQFLFSFVFLLLLIGFLGCSSDSTAEEEELIVSKTPVTLTHITLGPITETVELNAVSIFQKKISVKSTTTGYIEETFANLGSNVGFEQQLFKIQTRESKALQDAGIDSLMKFSGMISIKSQKAGVITTLAHQKGDYVQDGEELAVISDRSSLVFLLQVPFEMNSFVRIGSEVEIVLPGDSIVKGKIIGSLPQMDASSQTQQFVVQPITNQQLPENLIAKVRIVKNTKPNTTLIPKEALLSDETQTEFWVMKLINDTTAIKQIVKLGIQSEDQTEIISPVFTENDRILLEGNYGLSDTAKISIREKE